ncbi:MAG: carboxypeptidase regulatory-like domain-containing protein [Planctomycetes bacterium]|nr:carboxypeptidase regulatory-like domain-containing protein [Planctomycetota bacterium]
MKQTLCVVVLSLASLLGAGCGSRESQGGPAGPGGAPGGGIPCDSGDGAAVIKGKASFEGEVPEAKKLSAESDPVCAAMHKDGVPAEDVKVKDGALANVFVWVKKGLTTKYPAPTEAKVLTQSQCRYEPHVMGLQVGQPLTIKNQDETMHNVHSLPRSNQEFNFAQTKKGDEATKKFSIQEVMVKFKCDAHGWMSAYVGVVNNPFYAVTAEDGTFEIKGLPAGEYVIGAWHEKFGTQELTVKVGDKETQTANFTFKAN